MHGFVLHKVGGNNPISFPDAFADKDYSTRLVIAVVVVVVVTVVDVVVDVVCNVDHAFHDGQDEAHESPETKIKVTLFFVFVSVTRC